MVIQRCRWSLENGWDEEYGGIYLACHAEGGEAVWHQPDAKVWWTSTEALLALLRVYEITREDWCLEWYWKVHDYSFRVFPDREHGEWHQNLDRRGNVTGVVVKGLQVKDPFHLRRSLIYGIQVLRRRAPSLVDAEPGIRRECQKNRIGRIPAIDLQGPAQPKIHLGHRHP